MTEPTTLPALPDGFEWMALSVPVDVEHPNPDQIAVDVAAAAKRAVKARFDV